MSADGFTYEFVLRKGVRFHNGEPITADDVKFSFERYRGIPPSPSDPARARQLLAEAGYPAGYDQAMFLPVWQLSLLTGYGPRVAEPELGLIAEWPWSAPYEDVKLKR